MANLITNPYASTQTDSTTLQNDFSGRNGEKLVADAHGRFYNSTIRGATFVGQTALTGTAYPVGTSTAPTFGLWNTSTTKNAELLRLAVGHVSGTIALGSLCYNFLNAGYAIGTAAPVTAITLVTPKNTLLNSGLSSSMSFFGATATLTTAGTTFDTSGISYSSATAASMMVAVDDIAGRIIVPPGYMVYITGAVAQTALYQMALTWVEVPV